MTMKTKRDGAWQVLVGARLALVAVLSVLTVREWWKKQKEPSRSVDATDGFLQRWRRWYYGGAETSTKASDYIFDTVYDGWTQWVVVTGR
jgi:hypothetical protein